MRANTASLVRFPVSEWLGIVGIWLEIVATLQNVYPTLLKEDQLQPKEAQLLHQTDNTHTKTREHTQEKAAAINDTIVNSLSVCCCLRC